MTRIATPRASLCLAAVPASVALVPVSITMNDAGTRGAGVLAAGALLGLQPPSGQPLSVLR